MSGWTQEQKLAYWFETGKVEPGFDFGFRWKAEKAMRTDRAGRIHDWVRESGRREREVDGRLGSMEVFEV
jgi:hypothetical protein